MKRALLAGWLVAMVTLAQLAAACDDQAGGPEEGSPPPSGGSPLPSDSRSEEYPEGTVSIGISTLDVGLLKGGAAAEAEEGWRVAALKVTATDAKGEGWTVLELPQGIGSPSASELFEVVVQELSRGDHLEITVTATFESDAGERVEREASDRWPP